MDQKGIGHFILEHISIPFEYPNIDKQYKEFLDIREELKRKDVSFDLSGDFSRNNGKIVMTFPFGIFPSDQNIKNMFRENLFDLIDTGADVMKNVGLPLKTFITESFPPCSFNITVINEEKQQEKQQKLKAIRSRIHSERSNIDHDCGDLNCPHINGTLEYLVESLSIDDGTTYNFDNFNPFDFPILVIPNYDPLVYGLLSLQPVGLFRVSYTFRVTAERFLIPRVFDLVEAVFFPSDIPDSFDLQSWGSKFSMRCQRRYNFLGLQKYLEQELVFEKKDFDVCIIGWIISEPKIRDMYVVSQLIT